MNKSRKFRRLAHRTVMCEETLCLDRADRSASSGELHSIRIRAAASQTPSPTGANLRLERIASIRTAIAEGRYHVSAANLAQKLIDHMLADRPPKR